MKRLIIPVFFLLAALFTAAQAWHVQNPPNTETYNDVCFINADEGWVVGQNGLIVHTADGGATWTKQDCPVTSNLTSVAAMHKDGHRYAAIAGESGTILLKTDGSAWIKITSGIDNNLWDVQMLSPDYVIIAGDGVVLTIENLWRVTVKYNVVPYSQQFTSINFSDQDQGWAGVYQSGWWWQYSALYRTIDGGSGWDFVTSFNGNIFTTLKDIVFPDQYKGWICAVGSGILHTEDGGGNWILQYQANITGICFSDTLNGWAVGARTILHTADGGLNWQILLSDANADLTCIQVADTNRIIAAGRYRSVYRSDDNGATWNNSGGNDIDQDLVSVCFANQRQGWTVGNIGMIAHTSDKGAHWQKQTSGIRHNLMDVSFPDSLHGWITGDSGTILHTSNGGVTWNSQSGGTNQHLRSVCFTDRHNGWAAGDSGIILHTSDGGVNWGPQEIDSSVSFVRVTFLDSLEGWAAGNKLIPYWPGLVFHTTNGGLIWQKLFEFPNSYSNRSINDMFFTDNLNGWLTQVGSYPTIQHTSDGGITWSSQYFYINGMNSIWFTDSINGWIAGGYYNGISFIFQTNDGGRSWDDIHLQSGQGFKDIFFTDLNTGWAVGYGGWILHADNAGAPVTKYVGGMAICAMDSTAFHVDAIGPRPLNYQWQKDLQDIQGATDSTYIIRDVLPADSGMYRCIVSSAHGADTSNEAKLQVNRVPPAHIYGLDYVSEYQVETYAVFPENSHEYTFTATNGIVISQTPNSVTIHWGTRGTGFVNLVEKSNEQCTGDTVRMVVVIGKTGINEPDKNPFALYPNPVLVSGTFSYWVERESRVSLQIFNACGQSIDQPIDAVQPPGTYLLEWDRGANPPGIYYYKFLVGDKTGTGKMVLGNR